MFHYLVVGVILGLSAGFSPGPLLALVMSETLRHGIGAGFKVALAPLLTDLPIVILALLVVGRLSDSSLLLGLIAVTGGCFLTLLGWRSLKTTNSAPGMTAVRPKSLLQGVFTNFLSPHPYLFWISVGAPTTRQALARGTAAGLAFVIGFYICLVGAKVLLAVVTGRGRAFLSGAWYRWLMRFLGLMILGLAGLLFYDAWRLLGGYFAASGPL